MMQIQNASGQDPEEIKQQLEMMSRNQTLEINSNHPIIIKINKLRKVDSDRASKAHKQLLDSALVTSGAPIDMKVSSARNLEIIDDLIKMRLK